MAQNKPNKVLLGFEDELITEKNKGLLNYTVNKIGGKPDVPSSFKLDPPTCPLCQLPRPLVVQVYAPLENSSFHRTLYIFACINPNCWNQNDSWVCIRIQTQEKISEEEKTIVPKSNTIDWCPEADDWDDNNANFDEENGNIINSIGRLSDEDEESFSLEESVHSGFGNLMIDDKNANTGGAQGGAVGRRHSPSASAEIEGDEGEVITIDTPTMPQKNLVALLQEAAPVPHEVCQSTHFNKKRHSLQFISSFINVWEETGSNAVTVSDNHVKELLQEYQNNADVISNLSPDSGGACGGLTESNYEKYEKSNPAHGDKMFHHFLSKLQLNCGQILRYCRDMDGPLLLYPQQDLSRKCQYCKGDTVFEFQILPTIIPKLVLSTDVKRCTRLEFGTILIYTCLKSCWSSDVNFRYETVILQMEAY